MGYDPINKLSSLEYPIYFTFHYLLNLITDDNSLSYQYRINLLENINYSLYQLMDFITDLDEKETEENKTLIDDYISREEIWACTSCNACFDACPINIDPASIILDLRRFIVMEESKAPSELNTLFTNIENNGSPWQISAGDRLNWKNND